MDNLRIVFFGTPDFVIPVMTSIQRHFNLVGVVTIPDTVQGRKKILTPTPVKEYIVKNNDTIPVLTPDKLQSETETDLKKLAPDLFVVAAYGKIIPQTILDIPTFGSINVHPSLLPNYRGASPIQSALLNGDSVSGVTLILMDQDVDHGPILAQTTMPISPSDTFVTLHKTMFEKAAEILPQTIQSFTQGELVPTEQEHSNATFCDHITKEQGYFDLQNPPAPETLDRMIRAFSPWPTAWTIWKRADGTEKIIKFLPDRMIQIEGKKPMTYKEFFNGYPELKERIEKLGVS